MEKLKNFLYILEVDKKIWGNNLIAPPLFDALALLFVMVLGAVSAGATILNSILNTSYVIPSAVVWLSVTIVFLYLVGESVFGGRTWQVCLVRPLLMVAEVVVAYFLGYLLSAVIIAIVSIVLAIIVLVLVLKLTAAVALDGAGSSSGVSSSGGNAEKEPDYILQDGLMDIKLYENGSDYKGDDGHFYEKNDDGSFSRKQ